MKTTQKLIIVLLFLVSTVSLFAQNKCDCAANYKWVKKTFEKNDAGFAYGLQQKGQAAYDKLTSSLQNKITPVTSQTECITILNEYLSFFRKAHFSISANNPEVAGTGNTGIWPEIKTSEEEIRKNAAKDPSGFSGIWGTGIYRIAIVKSENGYKGVILKTEGGKWKPGQVKLEITNTGSGNYYMGDYSSIKFDQTKLIGKNTLKLGDFYLYKIYPVVAEDENDALYAREMSTATPFLTELSKETALLRIPSFSDDQRILIDSLIKSNSALLGAKKNLIIDIRNNGGGSDISYSSITPLLYTNPIRITSLELLSTPLNNQRMADNLKIPNLNDRSKKQVNEALEQLNSHLGQFVNLNGTPVYIKTMDKVLPNPQNVAVIINEKNGSTAEEFILMAKQSKKVKLFGKTTMGVLDISNMYFVDSPDKQFHLGYCLSKSLRIPDMKIDNIGLQPDFFIDKSIPDSEWLDFVKTTIEL
jgi:hypothetical protein